MGFEDPEAPTVLAGGGGLEDDEEFDITAACCLGLRGANLEVVSVVFLSISLLMIKRLILFLVLF
jgi:hypothetical protein